LEDLQSTLNHLWDAATRICDEILRFQPEVVVGLMQSGRIPLSAAVQLWTRTQTFPFPRTIFTNLGSEKFDRYNPLKERPGIATTFIGVFDDDSAVAHFLAWLEKQEAWQTELKAQFADVLGDATPSRILVVDEFIQNGSTWIMTLGLLRLILPQAQVHFLSAGDSFQYGLWQPWAEKFHPELIELAPPEVEDKSIPVSDLLYSRIAHLVNGTEDINPESLAWRPITADSEFMKQMSSYLPPEEWLGLPKFVDNFISIEIAGRVASYTPHLRRRNQKWPELKADWLLMCEMWMYGPRTKQQFMHLLKWPEPKMRRWLIRQIEFGLVVVQKQGRTNLYSLSPATLGKYWRAEWPVFDTYWVIPKKLLAGDFPYWLEGAEDLRMQQGLDRLLDSGITSFIDLSPREESGPQETYEGLLREVAEKRGLHVEYQAFPPKLRTKLWRLPKPEQLDQILTAIDQSLASGNTVYVHCNDGVEVTGVVVGCYLVRHGMTGRQALQEIERMRAGTFNAWKRSPTTERARRMLRKWKV